MRPLTYTHDSGLVTRFKVDRRGGICGKHRYSSRKIAKATARQQATISGENLTAYHCYKCHCWHIGHPPGQPRRVADLA